MNNFCSTKESYLIFNNFKYTNCNPLLYFESNPMPPIGRLGCGMRQLLMKALHCLVLSYSAADGNSQSTTVSAVCSKLQPVCLPTADSPPINPRHGPRFDHTGIHLHLLGVCLSVCYMHHCAGIRKLSWVLGTNPSPCGQDGSLIRCCPRSSKMFPTCFPQHQDLVSWFIFHHFFNS